MLTLFVNVFLKIFMIFTPFFVISAFLSLTRDGSRAERQRIAIKVTLAVGLTCFALFLFGSYIFDLFGITLDAFRIGAGAVLFLSAVSMIQGKAIVSPQESSEDVAVVPLAIPITVGPGTIGALLVMVLLRMARRQHRRVRGMPGSRQRRVRLPVRPAVRGRRMPARQRQHAGLQ